MSDEQIKEGEVVPPTELVPVQPQPVERGDVRFHVQKYIAEGWQVLPIPKGSKAPEVKDWVNRVFTVDDFTADMNIGVRLGTPSGNLIDVDLDTPQAVIAARPGFELLPRTERIHGRPGTGASHYWFIAEGKSERWQDTDGKVLIEIRSTGGQTVLPPSIHPSGELIAWDHERAPTACDYKVLWRGARNVATAALLARHWPNGSRHDCARDAAGFLAARDLSPREIENIIVAAATAANDEEVEDRRKAAKSSIAAFQSGGKTTGGPSLEASVGKEVVEVLLRWFGGNSSIHDNMVAEMNQTRFGTRMGKDYVYGLEQDNEVVFQKAYALFEEFSNQKIKVGEAKTGANKGAAIYKTRFEIWREHPNKRTYRQVVFAPPPARAVDVDYNLWHGFAVLPALPENFKDLSKDDLRAWAQDVCKARCQLFLDLVRDVICSGVQEHYDYLIKWMAYTMQFPGKPIEVAVMMRGDQGAGKGTFGRTLGRLLGRHYVHLDRAEQLAGKFNAALSGKVLIFADEAFFAGNKSDLGALKRLITEPTLAIERKGIDIVHEANHVHLIMATNEDFALNAGLKERRFFACNVSNHRAQDVDYFGKLREQMDGEGLRALLSYLLSIEVTHDEVRRVPRTRELLNQQLLSLSNELKWWQVCLTKGEIDWRDPQPEDVPWPDFVAPRRLYESYLYWCDTMRINRRVTETEFFRNTMAEYVGTKTRRKGAWVRPLHTLKKSRELFDVAVGNTTSWETDPEPSAEELVEGQKGMPF